MAPISAQWQSTTTRPPRSLCTPRYLASCADSSNSVDTFGALHERLGNRIGIGIAPHEVHYRGVLCTYYLEWCKHLTANPVEVPCLCEEDRQSRGRPVSAASKPCSALSCWIGPAPHPPHTHYTRLMRPCGDLIHYIVSTYEPGEQGRALGGAFPFRCFHHLDRRRRETKPSCSRRTIGRRCLCARGRRRCTGSLLGEWVVTT